VSSKKWKRTKDREVIKKGRDNSKGRKRIRDMRCAKRMEKNRSHRGEIKGPKRTRSIEVI
jgi:hypothetical protein